MLRSWDSSPQSLTTTQEQLTTLRGLPSRSIWPIELLAGILIQNFGICAASPYEPAAQPPKKSHTETSPLAELLAIGDLDKRDLVLRAERNDELLVGLLLARLVQDAHVSLATVEGLGGLAQTAGKSVVDEGELKDTLERLEDAHLARTGRGIGRDLDLGGRADLGLGIVFSVRLLVVMLANFVLRMAGPRW